MRRIRFSPVFRWVSSVLLLVNSLLGSPAPAVGADVTTADWSAAGVQAAADRMLQAGFYQPRIFPDGSLDLRLNAALTRAEYAQILARSLGLQNAAEALREAAPFTDVAGNWAAGQIAALEAVAGQHGTTLGSEYGLFRPGENVTAAEVEALLMKVLGVRPVPGVAWPLDHLLGAQNAGLLSADDAAMLKAFPTSPANRGLAVYLLDEAFGSFILPFGNTVYNTYGAGSPALTVQAPAVTNNEHIQISGSVFGATSLTVAGTPMSVGFTGVWGIVLPVKPGENSISVQATDMAGNITSKRLTVTVNPVRGGQLQLALWNSPEGDFNPITVSDTYGALMSGLMYDGLWRYDERYAPIPALAKSWEWNETGDTLTLHLRPGATFFDGTPVTAADVVFTYKAIFHPKYIGPRNTGFEDVVGWDEYYHGTSGETAENFANGYVTTAGLPGLYALDPQTVVFKLKQPNVVFLYNLAYGLLDHKRFASVPVQLWGTAQDPNNSFPNGTGAFRMNRYEPGQYALLDANNAYWAGRPNVDQILLRILSSDTALTELQQGRLDQMEFSAADYAAFKSLADSGAIRLDEYPDMVFQMMMMNTQAGPTAERAVRQALSYAINRDDIIHNLMNDHGSPMYGPIHPMTWAYTEPTTKYDYDPDKARALLDAAGWIPGTDGIRVKNGQRLHLRLAYPNVGNPVRQATAPVVQQWLRDIGVDVELVGMDSLTINTTIFGQHNFDLLFIGFQLGNGDPDLTGLWDKAATVPDGFNAAGWWTPESEALIAQGRTTGDPEQRKAIYAQWANLFNTDAPAYFFYTVNTLTASSPRLKNYRPGPQGQLWNLEQLWLGAGIDNTAPSLTVDPAPATTSDDNVVLTGTVSGQSTVTVNGLPVPVDASGHWSARAWLHPGNNDIRVRATDLADNINEKTLVITVTPTRGGRLNLAIWNAPTGNLNPIYVGDVYGSTITNLIYDGLWRYDNRGIPSPALAQSWEYNEAGDTLTLHLRPGATFFDGTPVTADDVVFTYKAIFHPKYTGPRNSGFEDVLGWSEYNSGTAGETAADFAGGIVTAGGLPGLYADDSQTVVFKLAHPNPLFLYTLAFGPVDRSQFASVPVQNWGSGADPNINSPNGTGPFKLTQYIPGVSALLAANSGYWAGRPHLDEVMIRVMSTANALTEMQQGTLDHAEISAANYSSFKSLADSGVVRVDEYPDLVFQEMQMNTRTGPTAEKAVRQAISFAIDRNQIINGTNLMNGHASPMYGPIHPLSWAYSDPATRYNYNPQAARDLLDSAGWAPGADGIRVKDGVRLHLRLVYPNEGNPVRQATAPVVQQRLKEVGIEVELVGQPWGTFIPQVYDSHDFDLMFVGFQLGNPDPDPTGIWDEASTGSGGNNASGWWTPESEDLIAQGRTTGDPEQRKAIYAQWASLFNQEAPAYFFYAVNTMTAAGNRLNNYRPGPQGQLWNVDQLWLDGYPPESPAPAPTAITGKVSPAANAAGRPAQVGIKGTSGTVQVNPDGAFYLPVPDGGDYTLQLFAPGYLRNYRFVSLTAGTTAGVGTVSLNMGDVNDSGAVDPADLGAASTRWRLADPVANFLPDPNVDLADLAVVARNAGLQAPEDALPVSPPSVSFVGNPLPAGETALVIGGRLHVTLAALEGLGFTVVPGTDGNSATIYFKDHTYILEATGNAFRDGIYQDGWDVAATTIVNGRIYVPFDLLASAIGLRERGGRATGVWQFDSSDYQPPAPTVVSLLGGDVVYLAIKAGWLTPQEAADGAARAGLPVPPWLNWAVQSGQFTQEINVPVSEW